MINVLGIIFIINANLILKKTITSKKREKIKMALKITRWKNEATTFRNKKGFQKARWRTFQI